MADASSRLRAIIQEEEPENIHEGEHGKIIANVAVSVDGTWQKRGHSSKIGVVFVISVRTGEILDYEVLSQVCHSCVAHRQSDKDSDEYKKWKENHDPVCQINHEGSSGSMEADGTEKIFARSIEKNQLRYIRFVGDGDSSCFGKVANAMKDRLLA